MTEAMPGGTSDQSAQIKIIAWGTRGSISVSGSQFCRYGGNTICIEVRCGNEILIFDAGTGIVPAGKHLLSDDVTKVHLFLTHCHCDHIVGLPFFGPLHKPHISASIWSGHMEGTMPTRQIVEEVMRPPWFPVGPGIFKAALTYKDFLPGEVLEPAPGIVIRTGRLRHPGGAVGYRVEYQGKVVAIITDTEHVPGELDTNVLQLIDRADLFFYDGAFCDEEMAKYHGFGHSSWQQGIRLAKAAEAQSVGLIHHFFMHSDDDLDRIATLARSQFASAHVVSDGQLFKI